jgi:hypothetical protein
MNSEYQNIEYDPDSGQLKEPEKYEQLNIVPEEDTDHGESKSINTDKNVSQKYIYELPANFNIIAKAMNTLSKIQKPDIHQYALDVLKTFQEVVLEYVNKIEEIGRLPSLDLDVLQDGSVLIEWIFNDFRLGISLEEDLNESSWYLVSKNGSGGDVSNFGLLHLIDMKTLIHQMFEIILARS